ncbi:MAG: PD40 domain-containing protein [Anaerolineae bacterium]|nr:PD40 domain-containing protein [Anaerolineae bacterium]
MSSKLIHVRVIVTLVSVIVFALGFAVVAVNAQGSEQQALGGAVKLLSEKLSITIQIIDSYTAEPTTFEDSGFGCPAEGETVVQGAIEGYKFTVVYQGVSYDIRTNGDGSEGRICELPVQPIVVGLATYRTTEYSLAYPETWNVVDRTTDVYFGPGALPACANPGMLMAALGRVSDKTADVLLDEYEKTLTGTALDPKRISVRSIGRSSTYQTKCTDGSVRLARVTAFVAFGRGFRLVQFAPLAQFPAWADLYMQILDRFSPSTQSVTSGGESFTLPAQSPLASIAHVFAGNIYVGSLTDMPGTPITSGGTTEQAFSDPVMSPDGGRVAFVSEQEQAIYVADTKGNGSPFKVADKLNETYYTNYAPVWSPDGSEVAYVSNFGLFAAKADGSGTRHIASLDSGTCEGIEHDPAQLLVYELVRGEWLFWGTDAIYAESNCGGDRILRIDPTSGDVVELYRFFPDETYLLTQASADGKSVLGIRNGNIAVLSLTEGKVLTDLAVSDALDVKWSADGTTLYYSTRTQKTALTLDDDADAERGGAVFHSWPFESWIYNTTVHQINLNTGIDSVIFEKDGMGIVDIQPAPDGSGVLFSFVQDDSALVEAFKANVSDSDLKRAFPQVLLYWLPLPAGEAQLVAITQQVSWGPAGSALGPTPTGGYTIPPNRRTFTPTPNVIQVTATPSAAPITATPTLSAVTPVPIRQALPTNTPRP